MKYLLLLIMIGVTACSFKSEDEAQNELSHLSEMRVDLSKLDSDGDLLNDQEEIDLGRNPNVADIPDLRVRFIQNYKVETKYRNLKTKEEGSFVIDTKVGRDDPDFKYRVGNLFLRDNSYRIAANYAKYSNHSSGEIKEHDLSWVKYPDVDPKFYSKLILDNKKFFDGENYEIQDNRIVLENSVRLSEGGRFNEIQNLELNFYYYDYESENYELIKTERVEQHFLSGVNEVFEVAIENVPNSLIEENYFKRGEFIISEVKDFDIPELGIKYSELIKRIKGKTVSVIYNTPIESNKYYVSARDGKATFRDILSDLFDKNFVIEEDRLQKIGYFENSLSDFSYLKEVRNQDKKGNWYVLTKKLKKHYLDHLYSSDDVISLSYITGLELATQTGEEVLSFRSSIDGDEHYKIYPLGNISTNSRVDLQIKPIRRWGERLAIHPVEYHERPYSCGRNCLSGRYTLDCYMGNYVFTSFDEGFDFIPDLSNEELGRIALLVNDREFPLMDLFEKQLVSLSVKSGNIHIVIEDISKILEIAEFEENLLSIKFSTFREESSNGFKLTRIEGINQNLCPSAFLTFAWNNSPKLSIATDSYDFDKWINILARPGAFVLLNPKEYFQRFSVNLASTIKNYFN